MIAFEDDSRSEKEGREKSRERRGGEGGEGGEKDLATYRHSLSS